ncbi:MAG: glycerol-3-phosphate acyltransferase [Solibacillus sp.]
MVYLYVVASYFLGSVLTAAIVAKLKGVNLQNENSGNLGARNAGRTLGKSAFVIVAIGDGLKGLFVVLIGRMLELPELAIALAVIAVVLGHLYPFWNKGQGGKGVATIIGAMVIFSPIHFLGFILGFIISMLITKSATLSMMNGFILYGILISSHFEAGWVVSLALLLVLWKQRKSILERVKPDVLE